MSKPPNHLRADLFCRVVDNLGDIGVMWRLARQLTHEKCWQIRLFVDRLDQFARIEPTLDPASKQQNCRGVDVWDWPEPWPHVEPNHIVIAGFSCDLPQPYLQQLAKVFEPLWLQLEYLSAEDWVASFHGLTSQRHDKLKPVFFFPGFFPNTGGLLREHDLITRREQWQRQAQARSWLESLGVSIAQDTRLVSVFTYPDAPLAKLIDQMTQSGQRFHLLVPRGQSFNAPNHSTNVTWQTIEFLSQDDYDKLLWSCDLNLVRGEDSWIRAIWAAKPFIWQIYPQQDAAHHAKLQAWLTLAQLPAPLDAVMLQWADGQLQSEIKPLFDPEQWCQWQTQSRALAQKLAGETDLATRIDHHCRAITTSGGLK